MRGRRLARPFAFLIAGILLLAPGFALAEVSVLLDGQGQFRRLVVITRGKGVGRVIWRQVRPNVPLDLLLNPLGDNRGDLAPTIQLNPVTGAPWAVWPANIANQKRLTFAYWTGKSWSAPAFVVTQPDPYYRDEVEPVMSFALDGRPFLVWTQKDSVSRIYFSTTINGAWTRPVLLSDPTVSSRKPNLILNGSSAIITYATESGPITRTYDSATLVESASKNGLMDTPIPPGQSGDPGSDGGSGEPVNLPHK